jgi:hypothetical protein
MKNFMHILFLSLFGLFFTACGNMEYARNDSFDHERQKAAFDLYEVQNRNDGSKRYGGLILNNFSEETGEASEYFVSLKRKKKRFYAETMLFQREEKENSFLEQAFFDFGLDKKKKSLGFNVTLKY